MVVDHALLYRVEGIIRGLERLYSKQNLAIQGWQKLNTGIDGTELQAIVKRLADHDSAGTAISFGTAFLAADTSQILA